MKIAVASGKGGTGKTFVATNIFSTMRKHGHQTTLVDCDAEAPNAMAFFNVQAPGVLDVVHKVPVIDTNACTFCGKCHEYCNYNAIFILPAQEVIQVIDDLCHGCGACGVACEYNAISEKKVSLGQVNAYVLDGELMFEEARMKIGVMSPVPVIKAAIKNLPDHEGLVILDAPPGTSCPFIHTVAAADFVILVSEPTPFGLSDLKQSVETLRTMEKPFGVIINRAGIGDEKVLDYLSEEGISLLMEIPFDMEIARHYSRGVVAANEMPDLETGFLEMTHKIFEEWK